MTPRRLQDGETEAKRVNDPPEVIGRGWRTHCEPPPLAPALCHSSLGSPPCSGRGCWPGAGGGGGGCQRISTGTQWSHSGLRNGRCPSWTRHHMDRGKFLLLPDLSFPTVAKAPCWASCPSHAAAEPVGEEGELQPAPQAAWSPSADLAHAGRLPVGIATPCCPGPAGWRPSCMGCWQTGELGAGGPGP